MSKMMTAVNAEAKLPRPVESSQTLSVLLAEDSAIDQSLVAAFIGRDGHSVRCVGNGRLAVYVASHQHFDVILMNKRMPDMDGLAATRAIRAGGGPCSNVPIIALTADCSSEQHAACIAAGMTELLAKPIDHVVLSERLSSIATGKIAHPDVHDESQIGAIPELDDATLHELEQTIGKVHFTTLLTMFIDELKKRPYIIGLAKRNGNATLLASESHTFKGVALNMGAHRVADAARRIEQDSSPQRIDMLVKELESVASATILAVEARLAIIRTA